MKNNMIGEQIQKFRKAAGLTQKELGEAIGVSSSAVSQWECGGTPDVTLLPSIADRLHVTIDALFGREADEYRDITEVVKSWVYSLPKGRAMDEICRLIWALTLHYGSASTDLSVSNIHYADQVVYESLIASSLTTDEGFMIGLAGEDASFMSVWPEPAKGYDYVFANAEKNRRFFAVLAEPLCIELLEHLCSLKGGFYTSGALAKSMGADPEQIQHLLDQLTSFGALDDVEITAETGPCHVYNLTGPHFLIAFLIMGHIVMNNNINYLQLLARDEPWLKSADQK